MRAGETAAVRVKLLVGLASSEVTVRGGDGRARRRLACERKASLFRMAIGNACPMRFWSRSWFARRVDVISAYRK